MNITPFVFVLLTSGQIFYGQEPRLAIKAPNIEAHEEYSSQNLAIKKMHERYQDLHSEILHGTEFCLVGFEQGKKLREYCDDLACLLERAKGDGTGFYERLNLNYMKDLNKIERLFNESGFSEVRPENLTRVLAWYARKNNLPDMRDFVVIGNYAKKDDYLLPSEEKGMRDVINFMKNPISRETFNFFSISRSELEGIELSQAQIQSLQDLLLSAQTELKLELLEENSSIIDLEKLD